MTPSSGPLARAIIADLYEYAAWANARLLGLAERLPDSDLRRRFTEGALPILDNFVHLASADRRWFARWKEEPLPAGLTLADMPSVGAVRRVFDDLVPARRAYIAGLDDVALAVPVLWQDGSETRSLVRWQALIQCANHGTQHRSEIAAMLTDCGHSPGDLDFGLWCRQVGR